MREGRVAKGHEGVALPYLSCMMLVASIYGLPPRILPSIHAVERGWPGAVIRNANNSEDLGVMQINTLWLKPLSELTGKPMSIVYQRLRDEPCYNIAAAGAILSAEMARSHGDLLRAVGNYHSRTPPLHLRYRDKVLTAARRLFEAGSH